MSHFLFLLCADFDDDSHLKLVADTKDFQEVPRKKSLSSLCVLLVFFLFVSAPKNNLNLLLTSTPRNTKTTKISVE
jgi:hypothetical protein